MSIYTRLTWPVVDLGAVCALQNIASAGSLSLDGTLFNISNNGQISFITANFIRSVSITSANNLSARTFVIQGFQNNAPITESIPGPNATTIYGTKYYDIITSVTVDGAVNGVQIGTGSAGYFPLITVNTNSTIINYSVSALLPAGSGINYTLYKTLEQVNQNFIAFNDQLSINFFTFSTAFTNQTISQEDSSNSMTNFILFKINSSANPLTDTFDFIVLQN